MTLLTTSADSHVTGPGGRRLDRIDPCRPVRRHDAEAPVAAPTLEVFR